MDKLTIDEVIKIASRTSGDNWCPQCAGMDEATDIAKQLADTMLAFDDRNRVIEMQIEDKKALQRENEQLRAAIESYIKHVAEDEGIAFLEQSRSKPEWMPQEHWDILNEIDKAEQARNKHPETGHVTADVRKHGREVGLPPEIPNVYSSQNPVGIVDHTELRCGGEGKLHRFHGDKCWVCGYEKRAKTSEEK